MTRLLWYYHEILIVQKAKRKTKAIRLIQGEKLSEVCLLL